MHALKKTELRLVSTDSPPAVAFTEDYTYEMWIDDLRGIVWNAFIKGRMSLEEMAVRAKLHQLTVERFVWRETKIPASRTVFQLAAAVDFRLPYIPSDADRQPAEQDFSALRADLASHTRP